MKLLTKELLNRFAKVGRQEEVEDPIVICKFFNPSGLGTWYATEYDPETRTFFGYVKLYEGELGYFSLDELESVRVPPFGATIERDLYFQERPLSQVKRDERAY